MMDLNESRTCRVCGKTKPLYEFRKDSTKSTGYRHTCKTCKNRYERQRILTKKIECIIYKGGQCALCGTQFNGKNTHIFDFHHLNESDKKFDISSSNYDLNDPAFLEELDKCILLCANCHRYPHVLM